VRVLFSCVVGHGHFHPLVALAQEMRGAGHEVAFATDPAFCPYVESCGFEAHPAGLNQSEAQGRFIKTIPEWERIPPEDRPSLMFPGLFAGVRVRPMLDDLIPLLEAWQPDLLIHDTNEMAGAIAARVAGLPHVVHSFGIVRPARLTALAAEELEPVCRALGVDNPGVGGNRGELYLDICPPAIQLSDIELIPNVQPLRPIPFDAGGGAVLPDWVTDLPHRPTVYVTMGTMFSANSVFQTVLGALREEPLNIIATVGSRNDPADLGAQPENVHVERYIPQSQLLPHCDLLISHAGSGATLGTLNAGVPLLAIPQGADQFVNADRIVSAGAGLQLLPHEMSAEAVRDGVRRLLDDGRFTLAARRIADQIAEMPMPAAAVPMLEALG